MKYFPLGGGGVAVRMSGSGLTMIGLLNVTSTYRTRHTQKITKAIHCYSAKPSPFRSTERRHPIRRYTISNMAVWRQDPQAPPFRLDETGHGLPRSDRAKEETFISSSPPPGAYSAWHVEGLRTMSSASSAHRPASWERRRHSATLLRNNPMPSF